MTRYAVSVAGIQTLGEVLEHRRDVVDLPDLPDVPAGPKQVTFSSIGYSTRTVSFTLP